MARPVGDRGAHPVGPTPGRGGEIDDVRSLTRLGLSVLAIFALFQWSASALGSDRGRAGVIVCVLVVAATFLAERLLFAESIAEARRALGFGRPRGAGLAVSGGVCLLLLLVVPAFLSVTGSSVSLLPNTLSLLPGLFAQGGVAEETLFRGYLFGHLRKTRRFWRAAWLSMLPFVAAHLIMFVTMPWPVALAAVLLAVVTSFPLAHLFELGGFTVWAPALLHFVIQGTVKILVLTGDSASLFPFVWIAASAGLPMLALLVRVPQRARGGSIRNGSPA